MAFRLKHREPLGHGIARVYRRQGKAALRAARQTDGPDAVGRVHDIRKRLKKMRALLRLVRGELGGRQFRTENHRIRDAGRLLSPLRDAEVRLQTFDKLRERSAADAERFPEIRRTLSREASLRAKHAGDALGELATALETAIDRAEKFHLARFGSAELCESLLSTYKKGRAVLRAACEEPTQERLHELRKRTKDLWYDLLLLQRGCPAVLKSQAAQLKKLTTLLGDYLDLTLLRTAIADSAPHRKQLHHLIDARQDHLQHAALDLANLFYAETPKGFAKRVSGYCPEGRCGALE